MKQLLIILLSALSLTAFAQQKKVAVYVTGEDAGINKVLGSKLVSAIARSNEFSAIERTESFLAELSKEQNYQRTGAVDDSELSRLGKQFGVQYICVAAVSEAFDEKYLSARLIDVETAQVERTASSSGAIQSLESLIAAANAVSTELLASLGKSLQSNSKKVAVYVVKNEAGRNIGRVLGDKLVAGFTNSGRYIAIERTNSFLTQLNKEQNYQRSGSVNDEEISRLGKQFGVQYVCVVEISDVFDEKYVSARLVDVETAKIVNSHDASGRINTLRSCLKTANQLADALSQVTIEEYAKEQARIEREGYVDLGLPSGTCWKKTNEVGLMTYREAKNRFGKYLPTYEQCTELREKCEWIHTEDGVRVIGPNGNYFTLKDTEKRDKDLFYASYLALPSFPTRYDRRNNKWDKCIHDLCIWATKDDPSYRGYLRTLARIDCYEEGGYCANDEEYDNWGIILCQQVDALAKRQHDDRTLSTNKEYTSLYTKLGEFYCDGSYEKNGQTFQTPYLYSLNKDYFRITFSFKALSYEGTRCNNYGDEKQYPIMLSSYHRSMGVCLHNDGTIFLETNNGDHVYETNIRYIPNQYCDIDIEYYKGWLTINGQKMWVETTIEDDKDKMFYSINYSSGNSFKGYLKEIKIYNVINMDE